MTRKLSRRELAKAIGISLQQLVKYERGDNRVTASRMHSLAHALDVDITAFFFQNDEAHERSSLSAKERRMVDEFRRIQSPADQEFVLRLTELLANA